MFMVITMSGRFCPLGIYIYIYSQMYLQGKIDSKNFLSKKKKRLFALAIDIGY